ncbi:MAG: hypothetical protein DIJKHBIC_00833 [Thermoanaerobaculia bacterium]|nr:hypothetical protein [Thermoanaerobaculia bacterium]
MGNSSTKIRSSEKRILATATTVLRSGSHYFNRTNPAESARAVAGIFDEEVVVAERSCSLPPGPGNRAPRRSSTICLPGGGCGDSGCTPLGRTIRSVGSLPPCLLDEVPSRSQIPSRASCACLTAQFATAGSLASAGRKVAKLTRVGRGITGITGSGLRTRGGSPPCRAGSRSPGVAAPPSRTPGGAQSRSRERPVSMATASATSPARRESMSSS